MDYPNVNKYLGKNVEITDEFLRENGIYDNSEPMWLRRVEFKR